MTVRILEGDVRDRLADLPDGSVQCCVTSPPYYGLRDYGVAGQLGLEPTLAEYIANMVAVFRDVRRVLRDDGTLWLNIGDSYAAGKMGRDDEGPDDLARRAAVYGTGIPKAASKGANGVPRKPTDGMKAKDLMMVPARLAIALQEPYYTGRIARVEDRIWLAAMIDAEGCMFIHKRKAGQHNGQGYYRQNDTYSSGLEISNTHRAIVERCMEIAGKGSICEQGTDQNQRRKQTLYRWNLRTNECRDIVREVYPYLVAKKHQARILIGCPPSGERAEAAHAAMLHLHNGTETTVDFDEPGSMFEQGWFLRSDIIWKKPNPMPESVTDRPTSAHEHIFLLTKNRRYYYDADAIREELRTPEHMRGKDGWGKVTKDHHTQSQSTVRNGHGRMGENPDGANARNVWSIATMPYKDAHFATFPPEIPRRCILAGSREGDTVLDPFLGSGTTLLVADRLGRHGVGIELNPEYAAMARKRITADAPLLVEAV